MAGTSAGRTLDLLHRSFITPIDRKDIYTIIVRVDHIFDYVKTAVRELDLLEVRSDESMQAMDKQLLDRWQLFLHESTYVISG